MKIPIRLIFATLIFTLACKAGNSDQGKLSNNSISPKIEFFSDLPQDIDGCTCMFSLDSTNYNNNKYIYVNDFAIIAYMKLDGHMNRLTLSKKSKFDNKATIAIYLNDYYEVEIKIQDKKSGGYESSIDIGIITVKNRTGQKTTIPFYGICGC